MQTLFTGSGGGTSNAVIYISIFKINKAHVKSKANFCCSQMSSEVHQATLAYKIHCTYV